MVFQGRPWQDLASLSEGAVMIIPKPKVKMKTVTRQLEKCLAENCRSCYLKSEEHCQVYLMQDALYYLRMTLEKSKKKR